MTRSEYDEALARAQKRNRALRTRPDSEIAKFLLEDVLPGMDAFSGAHDKVLTAIHRLLRARGGPITDDEAPRLERLLDEVPRGGGVDTNLW